MDGREGLDPPYDAMMVPEPWPPDRAEAVERLTAILHDIDASSPQERGALLADLLRVAWPTWWAQDQ